MKIYCQKILLLAVLCLLGAPSNALLRAQIVIGGTTPNPSAELDVQSANRGFLLPRMTSDERNAIANPATGLQVFNTTLNCIEMNAGSPEQPVWICLNVAATVASSTPTLCANTPLVPITHTTTGATAIGVPTGLPTGVSASWMSNRITISGTPTEAGTFNYSIPLTGGLVSAQATGRITVTPNAAGPASSSPTLCVNTALTPITHTTTGATGIGTATNLPPGVSVSWASNLITISGTPTAAGTYIYSIPLTGLCGSLNATGTITVSPNRSAGAASATPTLNINTALTAITHTTTGATGIGTPTNLPTGVTASWAANVITISGTPTAAGTFSYSIPLTGGCGGNVNATGTITVNLGCGAYIASGVWKTFKCHNLGADESADPFTPSWRLNGHYYQWGRNTNITSGSPRYGAAGPTGPGVSEANNGPVTSWNAAPGYAPNGAWADASKTSNDPCPAGFRVPTLEQWSAVINTSLNPTRSFVGSWNGNFNDYDSGLRIGAGSSGLYLPAAGNRSGFTGELSSRSYSGSYTSTTVPTDNQMNILFFRKDGNLISSTSTGDRSAGLSVRCIAQ